MNWYDWTLVVIWVLSMLVAVMSVGQPRQVITPEAAALYVLLYLSLICGLVITR